MYTWTVTLLAEAMHGAWTSPEAAEVPAGAHRASMRGHQTRSQQACVRGSSSEGSAAPPKRQLLRHDYSPAQALLA